MFGFILSFLCWIIETISVESHDNDESKFVNEDVMSDNDGGSDLSLEDDVNINESRSNSDGDVADNIQVC